jgi:hypothetical protein
MILKYSPKSKIGLLCASVADPGCFIPDPDPTIALSQIRIPDPGGKKAPDPGSDFFLYKG